MQRNAIWRRYQLGIYRRYAREGDGWQQHLGCSKRRILEFVTLHSIKSVTILGSGWLLDVPLGELASLCQQVVLADRYHPRQSVAAARQFGNVELVECDVTGGLELLKPTKADWPTFAERIAALRPPELPHTEAVVSLNLLSQLSMPIQERYSYRIPQPYFAKAISALEQTHLALLARYAHWLLITDTEERHRLLSSNVKLSTVKTVHTPLSHLYNRKCWEWNFDASGYYTANHRVTLYVESGEGEYHHPSLDCAG